MKNIIHVLKVILSIYASVILQSEVGAVIWEDTFEQAAEDDWKHKGNNSIWKLENGFLKAEIHAKTEWNTVFELYQFIAYPGPQNGFTIALETIGSTHDLFGIALAKHFWNPFTEVE